MITQKIDAITEIPEEYRKAVLPAPKAVKIELTSRCNFQCGFCANRVRTKIRGEMPQPFYERVVKDMVGAGVRELGLFYIGEPFMCSYLPEAIAFAKKVGIEYVFITTNGALASPDKVADCMRAGLDSLKFSYNYCDGEQLHSLTGAHPNTFEKVQRNIAEAWRIRRRGDFGCGIYASSILYDSAQHQKMRPAIDAIYDYIDEHYWLPLYSFGSLAAAQEAQYGYRPKAGNPGRLSCMREPLPCWAAFKEGHVTHDGKLSACCFDAGDLWEMADLNQVDFMTGWNSEKYQVLRAAHLRKHVEGTACEQCAAYK